MKNIFFVALCVFLLHTYSYAETNSASVERKEWRVIHKVGAMGKPPYKRRSVSVSEDKVSAADIVRQINAQKNSMVRMWTVDMSGKPPYKRRMVDLSVVGEGNEVAAELPVGEKSNGQSGMHVDRRGSPPFKRSRQPNE